MGDNLLGIVNAVSQMRHSTIDEIDCSGSLMWDEELDLDPMDEDWAHNETDDHPIVEANNHPNVEGDNEPNVDDNNQPNVISAPYIGLQYSSHDDAYELYNCYAKHKGFGIRKYSTYKSKKTGEVIGRLYVCNKQGTKSLTDKRETTKDVHRRRETRTGCMAKMWINKNQGTKIWTVRAFDDIHNHEFSTPSTTGKHRSHKKFHRSKCVKNLIDSLHDEGLAPSTISKVINVHGGKDENITPQQCQDHLRIKRGNNIGRECVSIIKHFQNKKDIDPLFFFAMELDDDQSLRSVFWADGRSITSYLEFGDVVSFDVTYRTNKFSMPFAPFTGVNHHRQSTLFGCALLADETEDTFVWLFEQWMKCMCGKAPRAIITDQDRAICNSIKRVFPHTRHRYCSWHVDKHVKEHLLIHFKEGGFSEDYQAWFNSKSISESESRWETLKEKYGLHSNNWLMNMYELRRHWVPAYLRDIFTAGMKSSQRSESINAFFDDYVHAMTPLNEFVTQYDKALIARRKAEKDEDFKSMDSKPRCDTGLEIELQAANCYTRKMYDIFHVEFAASVSYWKEKVSKNGGVTEYIVGKSTRPKNTWKTVIYDISDGVCLTCSCAKFETEGMLCRHILCIMKFKMIATIPDRYILKRWTIDARYRLGGGGGGGGRRSLLTTNDEFDNVGVTPIMMFSLRAKNNKLLEEASSSISIYKEFDTWMDGKLVEIAIQKKAIEPLNRIGLNEQRGLVRFEDLPQISVRDPSGPMRTKGRPKQATRFQSGREVAQQEKEKRSRTCGHCQEKGHYRTGCPQLKNLS